MIVEVELSPVVAATELMDLARLRELGIVV